jgi:hypothetical protein
MAKKPVENRSVIGLYSMFCAISSKSLFIVSAVIEAGAGLALLVSPALSVSFLFGSSLEDPSALAISRVTGAALVSLAVACWLAREDEQSRTATGLIWAMLLYNVAVAMLLTQGHFGSGLSGIGLWPGIGLHVGMAVWCSMCVRKMRG